MDSKINLNKSYYLDSDTNRIILAFIGGIALSLSLPFVGWWIFAWLALVPLLILAKTSDSYFGLAKESFTFGIVYNLISFIWLLTLHPLDWQGISDGESFLIAILAWLLPSLYHTFFIVVFALICKLTFSFNDNRQSLSNSILLAFVWVIIQHKIIIHFPLFNILAIPINELAYSQYQNLAFLQIANKVGAIGVEFVIVLFNLFMANIFCLDREEVFSFKNIGFNNHPHSKSKLENQTTNLFFLVTILAAFTLILINGLNTNKLKGQRLSYGIVQGNLTVENIRGENLNVDDIINVHSDLSEKFAKPKDIVIWPEGAVPTTKAGLIQDLSLESDNLFVFGTYFRTKDNDVFNSAALKQNDHKDEKVKFYHKRNLVPFGEYTPFLTLLPPQLKELAKSAVGNGFAPGPKEQSALDTKHGKVALSICFELLFPGLISKQVLSGAEYIINLSDLSWFKTNMVKKQFLAVAVMRAIENQKSILLASNTGFSAKISPIGHIAELSEANKATTIEGEIVKNNKLSIYTKYGW